MSPESVEKGEILGPSVFIALSIFLSFRRGFYAAVTTIRDPRAYLYGISASSIPVSLNYSNSAQLL